MIKFLIIFILFFANKSFSQESLMETKIELDKSDYSPEEFLNKLFLFVGKDFDSVDIQLLATGPTVGVFLVQAANENKEVTYGDLYENLLKLKSGGGDTYQRIKSYFIKLSALKLQPATLDNWNEMKRVFLEAGSNPIEMAAMDELMKEKLDSTMNLSEVIGEVTLIIDEMNDEFENELEDDISTLFSVDEAIDIELYKKFAAEEDLPLVIYFTGYTCVNCRKLEEHVLKDPEVASSLLYDFVFVSVYVDSQKELPENLKGSFSIQGREYDIETVGDYNRYFQLSEYNVMSQPYLVFMTSQGEILGIADYEHTGSVQEMKKLINEVYELLSK